MDCDHSPVTALVLAGARAGPDSVAQMLGVSNKAVAKVGGEPMISRVVQTLENSSMVGKKLLCGPSWDTVQDHPFLGRMIESGQVQWFGPQQGPGVSVRTVLTEHILEFPILITTADHVLLTVEMVEYFIRKARQIRADVIVGLVPYALVAKSYPHTKRTVTRFSGEGFCGCNLFVLCTPKAERLVEFWSHVERERKHPWRLIRVLGLMVLVRYVLGSLTLSDALDRLGRRLDLHVKEILLPFPEAAIDVDTPEDFILAEEILRDRRTIKKEAIQD